jgi:methylmalonyl-CoA mutase, N-terminal domain
LRTQQIIAHESGVADAVDAMGGSYLIEYLTDEIEQKVEEYITRIDDMGGAQAAIEKGFIQAEIQEAAYKYQRAVENRDEIIVGVNAYTDGESHKLERLAMDEGLAQRQSERLAMLRDERDAQTASERLAYLESAARGEDNLVPVFIACVENNVTLGEICGVLRKVWGEYQPPVEI